jgi:hypothetical protein
MRYPSHPVRWLVIFASPDWVRGRSRKVLRRILAGDKTTVGRFHLRRVQTPAGPAVFRVETVARSIIEAAGLHCRGTVETRLRFSIWFGRGL